MLNRKLFILSLMVTLASCQTSNTEQTEGRARSRRPQGEGRFFPPFVGFGGFRPRGFFGGGGGYPRPGGYPGLFGGYYPGAYRPGGYFQGGGYPGGYYGGYPQYPRPPRPGLGNRPFSGLGGTSAAGVPSVTRPGSDNTNTNRPSTVPNLSNLTPSQAALLGQALGASLRPLLMANGGAGLGGGGGGADSASPLADILAQLG